MDAKRCLETSSQSGLALLLVVIAVSVFSLIGLFLTLVATSEVKVTDNYESHIQARAAALAGLRHARALLTGLPFDDLLKGPDGVYDPAPGYVATARTHAYRSPVGWQAARMLDILDPSGALAGTPDDGIVNTGRHASGDGIILIPLTGTAQTAPDPLGPGILVTSRYFVKVSDNNGEASELARDPSDNPFLDGDGQIIVRSMGISQTLREETGSGSRRNSAVVFEARYRRSWTFELEAALVLQGTSAGPLDVRMFEGNTFLVQGGPVNSGIGTVDTMPGDGLSPAGQVRARIAPEQESHVLGAGIPPSIHEISPAIMAHPDKRLVLDGTYVRDFISRSLPRFAHNIYAGAQNWAGAAPDSLGRYDAAAPPGAPGQDPRVTYVDGDLSVSGDLEGAGILVVSGRVTLAGRFRFYGLVLIIGAGEVEIGGSSAATGAVYVASLTESGEIPAWGGVKLNVKESGRITFDMEAVRMALRLIPPFEVSFREVTSIIDP